MLSMLSGAAAAPTICMGVVLLFLAEHFGRTYGLAFIRLSTYLRWLFRWLKPIVQWLGEVFAELMAYLHVLNLEEMVESLAQFVKPILQFGTLPYYAIAAMLTRAREIASVPIVLFGTLLATAHAALYVLYPAYRLTIAISAAGCVILAALRWLLRRPPARVHALEQE